MLDQTSIIIPTYNAGCFVDRLIDGLRLQDIEPQRVLVIDSSSSDDTVKRMLSFGARVHIIAKSAFNHGGTRQLAVEMCPDSDFLIFLTQDAEPALPGAFARLLQPFSDPQIALAYGRQLPRTEAGPIESFARLRNYGPDSQIRSYADRSKFGIKTVFCSNSFCGYRKSQLLEVGGFPDKVIFAEDQQVAGKILKAGYKIAYVASAEVRHSHQYSIAQDFRRHFDIGVFHAHSSWLIRDFGMAEGEGFNFLLAELKYLFGIRKALVLAAAARSITKYLGYRLGKSERLLPAALKRRLSLFTQYWDGASSAEG